MAPGVNALWGKDLLFLVLHGDFKEDLYRGAAPSPAKGNYSPWNPMMLGSNGFVWLSVRMLNFFLRNLNQKGNF